MDHASCSRTYSIRFKIIQLVVKLPVNILLLPALGNDGLLHLKALKMQEREALSKFKEKTAGMELLGNV